MASDSLPRSLISPVLTFDGRPSTEAVSGSSRQMQASLAEDAAGPPLPPETPGFKILRLLGVGGQGATWLARREGDTRRFAIKVIHPHHACNAGARARFEHGFATLAMLDHPGIVRPVDRGELHGGAVWHATEYVSGKSITRYVNDLDGGVQRFPVQAVLRLFAEVCDVVEAAHRVGVIHRDLKPSNILIDDEGRPHVLDFGLAKTPLGSAANLMTLTGEFLGTPAYASPEQVEARPGLVDVRTDVYSLGVVLYELLTGTMPYEVTGPLAITFDHIRRTQPTPPRRHVRWVDRDLEAIVLRALRKERRERYQSVAEIRQDLQAHLAGRPVQTRGDSLAYQLWKLARRHRAAAAAAGLVIGLSAVYGLSMTAMYRRAESSGAEARRMVEAMCKTIGIALDQVDRKLENVIGAAPIRKELVERLFAELEPLLAGDTNDPRLERSMAQVHSKIADVAERFGDLERAWQHVNEALAMYERLVARNAVDADLRADLSIATVRVGDIAMHRGNAALAEESYVRALGIQEELGRRDPSDAAVLEMLCFSYQRVGQLAYDRGDFAESADLWRKRYELAARMPPDRPDDTAHLWNLYSANHHMFRIEDITGTEAGRREYQLAARELVARLVRLAPSDYRFHEAYMADLICRIHEASAGDVHVDAALLAREAIEALRRALHADPETVLGQEYVGPMLGALLSSGMTENCPEEVELWCEEILTCCDSNDGSHDDPSFRDIAAVRAHLLLAALRRCRQDEEAFRSHVSSAVQCATRCLAADAIGVTALRGLFAALTADPSLDTKIHDLALSVARRTVEVTQRRNPDALWELAQALSSSHDDDAAAGVACEALALIPRGASPRRIEGERRLLLYVANSASGPRP